MSQQSNAVILARVSSKTQEDEGYSLDSQLKLLRGYCEHKELIVSKIFKITETASKQQCRKVFQELLQYIASNNIHHLAVEKTDRLTRNFRDAVAIDDWLEQDGNRMLHAVKENLQLHKAAKSDVKFMWNIHLAVAKKYTDNLREEAMKGWAEKLAQGWLPSPPPPGYMTITLNSKRLHVPDPATKNSMQRVFSLYLEPSHTIQSIAHEMEVLGVRTKKGRPHSKSHVQRILNNPFYIGINRFDGKDYPGIQEQIINKDVFEKVQQKMHRGRPTVLVKHNPVLKNIIKCDDCGGVVTWQKQKAHYYGACQRRSESCRGKKLLREDKVESIVIELLEKLVCPSPQIIDWVASSIRAEKSASIENQENITAAIQTQLQRLQHMDNQLYEDKLASEISKEKYEVKHTEFMAQITELSRQKAKIEAEGNEGLDQRLVLLELSQKAAGIYAKKSPEQKRIIITKLFKQMTTHDGILSVIYTNFSRAIADRVIETNKLLGGKK